MARNILNVFIASPGDVKLEREELRKQIDRLNKILGRTINWAIELYGWEDTLPGACRPQELINKEVEICDLFIGILWKRWGQPTGVADSGFREEFEIAFNKSKQNKKPEMWLYLKNIDEELIKDPGEQLQKVLTFRDWVIASKALFYKEFRDENIWGELIFDNLMTYMLSLNTSIEANENIDNKRGNQKRNDITNNSLQKGSIEEFLSTLSDTIKKNEFLNAGFWDRARLMLVSKSLYSELYKTEYFGNHEINVFYSAREDWKISEIEKVFILKSSISSNFKPFWYWYKNNSYDEIVSTLVFLVKNGIDSKLIVDLFRLLNKVEYQFSNETIKKILTNKDFHSKSIIINELSLKMYIATFYNLLTENNENKFLSDDLEKLINRKIIEYEFLENPNREIENIVNSKFIFDDELTTTISGHCSNFSDEVLLKHVKNENSKIKECFFRELLKRKKIKDKDVKIFLSDSNYSIRELAIERLIESGFITSIEGIKKYAISTGIKSDDNLVKLLFQKMNYSELMNNLKFFSVYMHISYRTLIENYYDKFSKTLVHDFNDDFTKFFNDIILELKLKMSTDDIDSLITDSFVDSLKSSLIISSLEALNNVDGKKAIKYAKKFIFDKRIIGDHSTFLKIFEKHGSKSDAKYLLDNLDNFVNFERLIVLSVSLKLSPGIKGIIKQILQMDGLELQLISLNYLYTINPKSKIDLLKTYLFHKNDLIRMRALAIIVSIFTVNQLRKLLTEYTSNENASYYDVITWLDRIIYANGDFKKAFLKDLLSIVESEIKWF